MKGKLFDHFLNIFWKCTQPFTVLQNLNQHQLSVFLITIYNISKRATSLIYRMVCFSFSGAPNGMGHIWSPVQKSTKNCEKVGKEILHWQSMHHWCSAKLHQFYPLYTSVIFWETETEILGVKESMLWHTNAKWTKQYKFVFYMSKQSINFKNVETS